MESEDQIQYEKILTLNDHSFSVIRQCIYTLLYCVEEKCEKDSETMHFFQVNLTNSENSPLSKDLKIRWCVTKNE